MTFFERYKKENTWQGKVLVMNIFHLAMSQKVKNWTIKRTAQHFECSIGLISENLKLADAIHKDEKTMMKCKSREAALRQIKKVRIR